MKKHSLGKLMISFFNFSNSLLSLCCQSLSEGQDSTVKCEADGLVATEKITTY